jgi:hypothetical protein
MFTSEYNYSITLPEGWSEYETDEKGTNAFFNAINWTGNLRITPLNYFIPEPKDYLSKIQIEKNAFTIKWSNIDGIYYKTKTVDEEIYSWYLIKDHQLFICSFTIGNLKKENQIESEVLIVEEILKTIKRL